MSHQARISKVTGPVRRIGTAIAMSMSALLVGPGLTSGCGGGAASTARGDDEVRVAPTEVIDAPADRSAATEGCRQGDDPSCLTLATMYARGIGGPQQPEQARELFDRLCRAGSSARACSFAGAMWLDGQGGDADTLTAVRRFEVGCTLGDAEACTIAGAYLSSGEGVEPDAQAARRFFEQGCEGGVAEACFDLGVMLRRGVGGPSDPAGAAQRFDAACQAGLEKACGLGGAP